jgi:hypothetical protein
MGLIIAGKALLGKSGGRAARAGPAYLAKD